MEEVGGGQRGDEFHLDRKMTLDELAAATAGMGGHWGDVPVLVQDAEYTACESCDWHPLTTKMAETANRVFAAVRERGGGAPSYVYVHYADDLFLEWEGDDRSRVSVNFWPKATAPQVMKVAIDPSAPHGVRTEFFDLEGFAQ